MIRLSTPIHRFKLPIDASLVADVKIMYAQLDKIIIQKQLADCSIQNGYAILKLTQEETALFDCEHPLQIQMKVKDTSGNIIPSKIRKYDVGQCLDNEVM